MDVHYELLILTIVALICFCKTESEHRTKAAAEKYSDLYCYKCDTIVQGDRCLDLKENTSVIFAKCPNEQRICKVKTITMTTSTEDAAGQPKLWLLERNCSKVCEPMCVTIGERTKLRSCTTCCETSFCNSGNEANALRVENDVKVLIITLLVSSIARVVFDRDKLVFP